MPILPSHDGFAALVRQLEPASRLPGFSNDDTLALYAALTAITLARNCRDGDEITVVGDRLIALVLCEAMALKDEMTEARGTQ